MGMSSLRERWRADLWPNLLSASVAGGTAGYSNPSDRLQQMYSIGFYAIIGKELTLGGALAEPIQACTDGRERRLREHRGTLGGLRPRQREPRHLHPRRLRLHLRGRARSGSGLVRGVQGADRQGSARPGGADLMASVRALNDAFRTSGQGGRIVITRGVHDKGASFVAQALERVRTFDAF